MVAIATAAAVVASQALISGAFSLTQQAVQLGYSPAGDDPAHLGQGIGPDLHPRGERSCSASAASRWCWGCRAPPPWRGVRHRGDRHDDHHHAALPHGDAGALALAVGGVGGARGLFLVVDLAFFGANLVKIAERRLVPARRRGGHLPADDDVERRPAASLGDRAREHAAVRPLPARHRAPQAAARSRHGGVPHVRGVGRAAGAAAPPQAQQGAARARGDHVGGHDGDSAGAGGRADRERVAGGGVLPGQGALRLHGDAGRAAGAAAAVGRIAQRGEGHRHLPHRRHQLLSRPRNADRACPSRRRSQVPRLRAAHPPPARASAGCRACRAGGRSSSP